MKIAVIGTGKTGREVLNLLDEGQIVGPFNTENRPTAGNLQPADAAIIFVPGAAVDDVLQPVMDAKLNAAWGSTGYDWPPSLDQALKDQNLKWMHASNFSLGMQIIRRCLQNIGESAQILDDPDFKIHEIHHSGKQDAPSGTALAWREWLGRAAEITSERKGDIKGIHRLMVETTVESIKLEHQAHDRALFAEGALWAVHQLARGTMPSGFYSMETLFDQTLG